jgi:hypothetical protein
MTDTPLTALQCQTCGVWHAIPKAMHDNCVEEGGFWHCPNGHQRGYREGRKEREAVRLERDRLKQRVSELNDTIALERASKEAAAKKVKQLQKRAKAGVCPCCNRSFANMAAHMKTCHSDMDPNVVDLGAAKAKRA